MLKQALIKTVNTRDLKTKIVEKFFGYLRVNVKKDQKGNANPSTSSRQATDSINVSSSSVTGGRIGASLHATQPQTTMAS